MLHLTGEGGEVNIFTIFDFQSLYFVIFEIRNCFANQKREILLFKSTDQYYLNDTTLLF